jgi:methionyl-tRNA formyltransferase
LKIGIFISDDNTFAPKVLKELLDVISGDVCAVLSVPALSTHKNTLKFAVTFLIVLGPILFIRRSLQTFYNKFRASFNKEMTSVSNISQKYNIPFRKFEKINSDDAIEWIHGFMPDIIISLQPQIIRKKMLEIPVKGIINFHPGKLPQYRGPVPVFWALYNGEKNIGLSVHFMDAKIDNGEIVSQIELPIEKNETYYSLSEKITKNISGLLLKSLNTIENNGSYLPNVGNTGSYQSYPGISEAMNLKWNHFKRKFSAN